jgi:peptidoglycan/LPS O-acetylase OafA/YrhL
MIADCDSTSSNRIDALLSLRGVACLMVILGHCRVPNYSIVVATGIDLSWMLVSSGAIAVWIFFALSGYLMGKAFYSGRYRYSRRGVLQFWRNRAVRIVPLYAFVVSFEALFMHPEVLQPENWYVLGHIFTFTYQNFISTIGFNPTLWSLSVEVQFYLLVPLIYGVVRSITTLRAIASVMALSLWVVFFIKLNVWNTGYPAILYRESYPAIHWYMTLWCSLDIFLIGFLLNPLLKRLRIIKRLMKISVALFKAVAVMLIAMLYLFGSHLTYYHVIATQTPAHAVELVGLWKVAIFGLQPLTVALTSVFILAFEWSPLVYRRQLSPGAIAQNPLRLLEVLGNLSYGLYLWHYLILRWIQPLIAAPTELQAFAIRLVTVLVLSLIASTATYYWIELPAAKWKQWRA